MSFEGFYVWEHPKAQLADVLVLKRLRRQGHGFSLILYILGELGIELRTLRHMQVTYSWGPTRSCSVS